MNKDNEWTRKRLDRLVADHLAREGSLGVARALAQAGGVEEMVDFDIFVESNKISKALCEGDCGPALKWCAENRSRLKKAKSQLEFNLRVQVRTRAHAQRGIGGGRDREGERNSW